MTYAWMGEGSIFSTSSSITIPRRLRPGQAPATDLVQVNVEIDVDVTITVRLLKSCLASTSLGAYW